MPETEADAEPDTSDSQSGGTISNVDEESGSDIDSRRSEAAKTNRIAGHLRQPGNYNKEPVFANVHKYICLFSTTQILSAILSLTHQTRVKSHSSQGTTGKPWCQRKLRNGKHVWKGSSQACPNMTSTSWFPRRRGARLLAQCWCLRLRLTIFLSLDSVHKIFLT